MQNASTTVNTSNAETKYYLAYGSNLNIFQMKTRCPKSKVVGVSEIKDYQLLFKGSAKCSYLTIEKCEGETVPVGVWEVTPEDIASLDIYEGYPTFYYKTDMDIELDGKIVKAFVYIMHESNKLGMPTKRYMQVCTEGYEDFGFDAEKLKTASDISKNSIPAEYELYTFNF